MSFDNLNKHAQDIEQNAAKAEYDQQVKAVSSGGEGSGMAVAQIDYDKIKAKYHGKATKLFEPFTHIPDPRMYDAAIEKLHGAMQDLSHGQMSDPINDAVITANQKMSHIKTAGDKLESWSGAAADSFKTNFLDPFNDISTNHFLALGVMKGAVEAQQAMCKHAREDIDRLAHSVLDALDNVGGCSKEEWTFGLSIATAVAAIGAVPFTGGASAAAFAVVGATAAVGNSGVAGVSAAAKGGGGSPEQIINSMEGDINKITKEIKETEGKIAKALSGMNGEMDKDKRAFVAPKPALAGMHGKELTGDEGLGDSA